MIRRMGMAVVAAGVAAGFALSGLAGSMGTASAAPECGDFHWMGAAGSGQRDAVGLMSNGGMGGVVYQSYQQLSSQLAASGYTMTAEAVQYPAAPVPVEGGLGGWMDFMDSVKVGTAAAQTQFAAFTERCPDTKVVLAGYSQGAMVIHRNLAALGDDPHVAAALLIADGDRLPGDTTLNMGSAAYAAPTAKTLGVAQEHSFLASAPTSPLPPALGARTISVCDVGDPVCDYDPDSGDADVTAAAIAIHTAYVPTSTGLHAWGGPLYQLALANAPGLQTPDAPLPGLQTPATPLSAHGA